METGRRGARGQGRGGSSSFSTRNPVFASLTEQEGSRSFSDLSSELGGLADTSKQSAPIKRLYKEYLEIRKNPLPNISVTPLPKDFFEWHGNIRAPSDTIYDKGIFHFSITFSEDHPKSPPSVMMKSKIEHPCVKGGKILLDNLVDPSVKGVSPEKRYYYYSPGYTAQSILVQLHAFLYEGTVEIALENLTDLGAYQRKKKDFLAGVEFSVEQSLRFSCPSCRHRAKNLCPPLPEPDAVSAPVTSENSTYSSFLACYQTLKTDEEVALGLGISFTKNVRTGRLQQVSCASDLLSLNAYKGQGVREMWQHKFTHWMPIFLANSHPDRAMYLAKRTLSTIYSSSPTEFQPSMVLDFFPKLLTHLTLSFITEKWFNAALRILRGYCYMHRLFLQFLKTDPELLKAAKEKVLQFVGNPELRTKEHVPQLGELICLLSVSGHSWEDVREAYLPESQARGVLWIVKKHPEMDTFTPDPKVDASRQAKSFAAGQVGMQFLLTQLMFNATFSAVASARSTRSSKASINVDLVASMYDKHYSLIPWKLADDVWEERKKIVAVESYRDFYPMVGLEEPGDEEMLDTLRKAVKKSRELHYTGDKGITVLSPEEFEKDRLGKIKSLDQCVVEGRLHDNDEQWKGMCDTRFGLTELPDEYSAVVSATPWKHLYLQQNLQELVSKLNDNPDFKLLYRTLELSAETLTWFELMTFDPDNIKSGHFFLAAILEKLPKLSHLNILKGEKGLGEKGFKNLVKGISKSSGALTWLDMGHSEITTPCVKQLAETHLTSEGLKVLNLEGNPLMAEGTKSLGRLMMKHNSLPNLEELKLRKCMIPDLGIDELSKGLIAKKNIKKLDLSDNPFTAKGLALVLEALAYNPVLEELSLTKISSMGRSDGPAVSKALAFLFQWTVSLKKLNLWNTPVPQFIDKAAAEALAKNTTLCELDLGSTQFSNLTEFYQVFASKDSKLTKLNVEQWRVKVGDVALVVKAMEGRTCSLTDVDFSQSSNLFSGTSPGEHNAEKNQKAMTKFFCQCLANVTRLNLSKSAVYPPVMASLLKQNTGLVHLDLSFNPLGKSGMKTLAAGLMENTVLEYLRLDHCDIKAAGAHHLAAVLRRPECTLKELHVFCNYFEVPGIRVICEALCTNRHLQVIDLGMNKARKNGATAIVNMLGVNKSIQKIFLKFNYIPEVWALKIARAIAESPGCGVTEVKLAGNSLNYDSLINIVSILKECPRPVDFDLAERADYLDPDKLERTVFVKPLPFNVTKEMVKKLFYSNNCGAITSVQICKLKKTAGKEINFHRACYCFVEFAHKDSVELAMDLVHKDKAFIRGSRVKKLNIVRSGLGKTASVKE